jgi:hypothetical protein
MYPEADPIHLSRQIWQAVSDHALRAVARREFCPEQSRIENLRPVYSVDEDDHEFGRQLWCFEAMGITVGGRRQVVYGMMEFSVQYGLLEPQQSGLFEDANERDRWISRMTSQTPPDAIHSGVNRFWIWSAWAGVAMLTGAWITMLFRYLFLTQG